MTRRKVLLIGWDAADWKMIRPLMDVGQMPNLRRLVEQGSSGQISTLHPPLSPMLWTSIATGKRPFKHGIHGFTEPAPNGQGIQPVTNLSRTSKAIWNILNQNGLRSVVVGWWPSHPAEPIDGIMVSDHFHRAHQPMDTGWPMLPHSVHPAELAGEVAALRVHPDSLTPEMVAPFIPLAREIDQDQDRRLGMFLRMLGECLSIHAAAGHLLEKQSWDFFAVYYDAIDHFCHGFMRYHPPRQSWITERDFELYRNVVSEAYRLHDRMLGDLLAKAGTGATVILMSDHGFHPDHLRPSSIPDIPAGPAVEHRDFGILAMRGQGIRPDESLYGASVLDIAPTILALFGLPVGRDMDGKILSGAFAGAPQIATIPSWEPVAGRDGRHPPHTRVDPIAAQAALEQMVALGYIEPPGDNRETAIRKTVRELRYNLGESYQHAGRHREARAIFDDLHRAEPSEERFSVRLFAACQALGDRDGMQRVVEEWERRPTAQSAVLDWLKAQILVAEKRHSEALQLLEQVAEALPSGLPLLLQLAELYQRTRRWRDARELYRRVLDLDPDNARAYLGLGRVALHDRQFEMAAHAALDALQRVHGDPQAHYVLGLALRGVHNYPGAADAFRAALSLNPNYPEARRALAMLPVENRVRSIQPEQSIVRLRAANRRVRAVPKPGAPLPANSLIVVTGLPRSGTSMLMQMLSAGGVEVLSDTQRPADEDNPLGYFEFEPVKNLLKDSAWLSSHRGKAIKIVAPLLSALPAGLPRRIILCERDLEEVLDSQDRMLARRDQPPSTPERRHLLKTEYTRLLDRTRTVFTARACTDFLQVGYREVIADPSRVARRLNRFLGGSLGVSAMASAVDPNLHRNRRG